MEFPSRTQIVLWLNNSLFICFGQIKVCESQHMIYKIVKLFVEYSHLIFPVAETTFKCDYVHVYFLKAKCVLINKNAPHNIHVCKGLLCFGAQWSLIIKVIIIFIP